MEGIGMFYNEFHACLPNVPKTITFTGGRVAWKRGFGECGIGYVL
jgi:hypothetical protein